MEIPTDNNVIVGLDTPDDAGVYKLTDDVAIIQTVDFFTPIVDDPYWFGQVAAANALSDVYAMGGTPVTAMNLVCFPLKSMDIKVLQEVLRGGMDKLKEAKCALMGGHSVEDPELKYGLSVTGTIHPDKIATNVGARPGDSLILTKPLGTGIINTAMKAGKADEPLTDRVTRNMAKLNKRAAELMSSHPVSACTDATGFGLIGHLREMIPDSSVGLDVDASALPVYEEAKAFAAEGLVPGGTFRNRDFSISAVDLDKSLAPWVSDIIFDPQTSGGLIISCPDANAKELLKQLHDEGIEDAAVIGKVVERHPGKIQVT